MRLVFTVISSDKTNHMQKSEKKRRCGVACRATAPLCGFVTVALLTLSLTGCSQSGSTGQERTTVVKVKEMTVGTMSTDSNGGSHYSGTVEEENGTALSFMAGGTITVLKVKVGDRVRKGQMIAKVDPTSVRNNYEMAHTARVQAEDAYRRMKQLHDKGSLPEIKWVEVQSQLEQAISSESIAKKSLGDCSIHAPFDGVISEKYAEVGQNAAPGMPVVKLVTTSVLNVRLAVPEGEMAAVALNQRASIQVQALGGRHYEGRVVEKGVIADPVSRSYSVKVRVEKADGQLLPGMVSQVVLDRADTRLSKVSKDAVTIPASLVQIADDNSNFVWVDENGVAARRTVVCGEYKSNGVSILSGLHEGDRLIVDGQQKVCTGTRLKTK